MYRYVTDVFKHTNDLTKNKNRISLPLIKKNVLVLLKNQVKNNVIKKKKKAMTKYKILKKIFLFILHNFNL